MQRFFILLFLLFNQEPLSAQDSTYRGTDFWVGYGHHQFMEIGGNNSQQMILYLSAKQAANVTVSKYGSAWARNYVIPANSVIASDLIPKSGADDARLITLPCTVGPCGGEGIFSNKAIHIESDVPIAVYAHIYGSASAGATLLIPSNSWGYDYTSLNSKQRYAANCFSWTYIIAQHDSTVIEITPSATTLTSHPADSLFSITLNRGDIYQFMAGPDTGNSTTLKPEMTGTRVTSVTNTSGNTYSIAVFSGSSRTQNPAICGLGGGDNDMAQVFPLHTWGTKYLTAPLSSSLMASRLQMNSYKVLVFDTTTIVTRNGVVLTGFIDSLKCYYYESNTADYIEADKPIMVAQFMHGGAACLNTGVGDPDMYYLSPLESKLKQAICMRHNEESISINYVTMIIPTAGLTSLIIDGSSLWDTSYVHPALPGYSVVVKRWGAASLVQMHISSDSAFTGVAYGMGSVESYGFNLGLNIKQNNGADRMYPLVWKGTESKDWFTSKNWSLNYVPTSIDHVRISSGTPFSPELLSGQVATCKSISLETGANIDVKSNATLQLTGKP
jgi:hypothetical protein